MRRVENITLVLVGKIIIRDAEHREYIIIGRKPCKLPKLWDWCKACRTHDFLVTNMW